MVAVAHFPASLDRDLLGRVRRPLAAVAAVILVIDLIGLGLHLADAVDSPFASDEPTPARARIGGPEALVPGSEAPGAAARRSVDAARAAEPLGCLSVSSDCYVGPTAPSPPGTGTAPGQTPPPPAPPPAAVPVLQADVGVPPLGAQVSLGLGDGGCTTVDLTVLALGDCPQVSGEGPVVLNLGGTLLGD